MKSFPATPLDGLPTPPIRDYYLRVLAYIATAAAIAAGTYVNHFGHDILWLVPYALLYPHLAYQIGRRFKTGHARSVDLALLAIDALHAGASVALMSFSVVPSLMNLLMIGFSALVVGGLLYLGLGLLMALGGVLLCSALVGPRLAFATPPLVALVSILFSSLFICISAYFAHQQGLRLAQVRNEIRREQEKAARLAHGLAKYLSPQVWESIFKGKKSVRLETQRKRLSVFFSDIKGFTELSEELEAESLTDLLNTYLNEMSKIALKHGGTIDKFVGDCVMVFFGDPSSQDYTIIGREVNLASRLESASEAGEILISHETYSLVKDVIMCRDKGQITVKGFSRPVQIYQVVDFRRDLGASSSYVEHELPGFSMYLDTNGIQNFDKDRVVEALQQAAEKLKDKVIL